MSLTMEIPESIEQALRQRGQRIDDLFIELAVALYGRGILSFGKALELSKLDRLNFGRLLTEREVPRHYGEAEFLDDVHYARGQ